MNTFALARLVPLAWAGLAPGAWFCWRETRPEPLVDALLAPLAAILLYGLVAWWTDRRAALAAVGVYAVLLILSLTAFDGASPGVTERHLAVWGSPMLVVGLGGLVLLEGAQMNPLLWSVVMLAASNFHPQFAFVPLLAMTLLHPRPLLDTSRLWRTRGAAVRCILLSVMVIALTRTMVFWIHPVREDSVVLPAAWWVASWFMVGEVLMPLVGRALLVGILCLVTVADYPSWPAMGLVLLVASALHAMRK
ncbi:MAG: hypothetical protein FJX76_16915 [Armatimonadetes bacterium]|nr:hypothetical protein [Armatimonadota bacterium]